MSMSAKIYNIMLNDPELIFTSIQPLSESVGIPRIDNLENNNERITGRLVVEEISRGIADVETYEFIFDFNRESFYLIGRSAIRDTAISTLNNSINSEINAIEQVELTSNQIVTDIFQLIRNSDNRNFIQKLRLMFGRQGVSYLGGRRVRNYTDIPLYELEYRFIGNQCASNHLDFRRFTDNAIKLSARFGIWTLGPIDKSNGTSPLKLEIRQDFSFRVWTHLPGTTWIEILNIFSHV